MYTVLTLRRPYSISLICKICPNMNRYKHYIPTNQLVENITLYNSNNEIVPLSNMTWRGSYLSCTKPVTFSKGSKVPFAVAIHKSLKIRSFNEKKIIMYSTIRIPRYLILLLLQNNWMICCLDIQWYTFWQKNPFNVMYLRKYIITLIQRKIILC